MANASIEVSGPDAESVAVELRAVLASGGRAGAGPVEVDRSAELVIAVIGLVFSTVEVAETIWEWWHGRRRAGVEVRILLDDGNQVLLSGVDQQQFRIVFEQRVHPGGREEL